MGSTYQQPGTILTDHRFSVPVDHDRPDGEHLELYGREIVATERVGDRLPWLLFLQGGPGMAAPRPVGRDGWLDRALDEYRVLLLDQRGTGMSTPSNRQTLGGQGDPRAQAEYLSKFRADAIVRDAELIRRTLIGDEPWTVLGQSFGGFCSVAYLSTAPQGLTEVFITGGLPGIRASADDVYRALYPRVAARNAAHYERYPDDVARAKRVAAHLREREVRLPAGGLLTVEAFQALGQMLGGTTASHALHGLLENAFVSGTELSDNFLYEVQYRLTFASAPLYAVLHEACYAQGSAATRWAAHRIRAEFPDFDAAAALDGDAPLLFTGEMIYPWMFETDPVLWPLRDAAHLLAEWDSWPNLYDEAVLGANQVPVTALVYHDDMYVDYGLSMRTAGAIRGLRYWVTNEYEHDGLRVSGRELLDRLISFRRQGRA